MKKVLRYALDDFLQFINDNDVVFDNRQDKYVECSIAFKMDDGSYRVLLGDYICEAQLIEGEVVAFREHDIYLEQSHFELERRCMAYNDRLYLMEDPEGFIDEIFILGTTEPIDRRSEPSPRLENVVRRINNEHMSNTEKVELLMESYEEDMHPFFRV